MVRKDTEMLQGEIKRGTKVICYLKGDELLLEAWRLKAYVQKYSHIIGFPIVFV